MEKKEKKIWYKKYCEGLRENIFGKKLIQLVFGYSFATCSVLFLPLIIFWPAYI